MKLTVIKNFFWKVIYFPQFKIRSEEAGNHFNRICLTTWSSLEQFKLWHIIPWYTFLLNWWETKSLICHQWNLPRHLWLQSSFNHTEHFSTKHGSLENLLRSCWSAKIIPKSIGGSSRRSQITQKNIHSIASLICLSLG